MRVYENSLDSRLTHWLLHCDRLLFSLKTFGWQQPDWNSVRQGAEILLLHFPILRITLFPDAREWITGRLLPDDLTQKQKNGIICAVVNAEYDRSLAAHKTGNYLSAWLAKTTSQQLAAQEAILVDGAGNWLETSTGNLWGWRDGCWWTPPLAVGILPGIVRSQLVKWLQSQQHQVQEEPWTMELVKEFEAIAYTNSVVETLPIHTVKQPAGSLEYNPHHSSFQMLRSFFSITTSPFRYTLR